MACTNEKLEEIEKKTKGRPEQVELWCIDLEELIERLKCAESYINARTDNTYQIVETYDRWRKSCGD